MNSKTLHAWLELLRVPNLLTVPGDVMAGWALASMGAAAGGLPWLACAASLCFYAAGLLLNDVADVEEDRAARPGRPIPSGRVSSSAATVASVFLAAVGVTLCLFVSTRTALVATALLAVVALYDLRLKRIPVIGPLAMGACRGLNLMLGAAASPAGLLTPVVLIAAGAETLYIAVVTQLARGETRGGTRWTPSRIGMLIGGLLWVQAAFCIAAGGVGTWIGIALVAMWPLLRVLRRRFEMS